MRSSRAGAGGRKRAASNGGQRVFLVNTLFWKILVTRVKRKMSEAKILIPLRELAAANSSNQPPSAAHSTPPRRERCEDSVTGTSMSGDFAQCANPATSGRWSTRSFGEYAFLEDSRYTSQAKNAVGPQFEFFQRAITSPRNPRGSSVHPRTALMRSR